VPRWPVPHLSQRPPCPALLCRARTANAARPCNYFEQACDSRLGVWALDAGLRVGREYFAQISLGLGCCLSGLASPVLVFENPSKD
jgi:hypothetical protein